MYIYIYIYINIILVVLTARLRPLYLNLPLERIFRITSLVEMIVMIVTFDFNKYVYKQ